MRKLWMAAVMAVAGLALATGCQDKRDSVMDKRAELNKTVQENRQEEAEKRLDNDKDLAKTEADKQEDLNKKVERDRKEEADQRKDLADAQQDLAKDRRDDLDNQAIGGAGMAGDVNATLLTGTIKKAASDKLTLVDQAGVEQKLKVDDTTKVTQNGQMVKLKDFKEGTQVRASYVLDKHQDKVARDVQILSPVMKK